MVNNAQAQSEDRKIAVDLLLKGIKQELEEKEKEELDDAEVDDEKRHG